MKDLITLLVTNKRYWVPPILLFAALLAWLAWRAAHTPNEAFDYRYN